MIDLHSHLLPGVDDGAADLEEATAAIEAMRAAGIRTLVATPHFDASTAARPEDRARRLAELDVAAEGVATLIHDRFPDVTLHRGVELMIDSPEVWLDDDRLRLAGTSFVLVEFPGLMIPPHSVQALYEVKVKGWRPVVAHPERYRNLEDVDVVAEWRGIGCLLQVNHGSIAGRYGSTAQALAWKLLRSGWVDYLSSDYHARGALRIDESRAAFEKVGGHEQFQILTETNPGRLLKGEEPLPVEPLASRLSLWKRLTGGRR